MRKKNENVALTLEERNIECANEWKTFGTIRNARFISVEELSETKSITCSVSADTIILDSIPDNCEQVWILAKDEKHIDLYTEEPAAMDLIYPDYKKMVIQNVSVHTEYSVKSAEEKFVVEMLMTQSTWINFYDSPSEQAHYRMESGSFIDLILLKDGWIRVEMKNMDCEKLMVRDSNTLEQALDIVVDDLVHRGDFVIDQIEDGKVIYAPVLAAALQRQAVPVVVDMNRGLFYSYIRFGLVDDGAEAGNVFVDLNRYNGISNMEYAQMLFENEK
ncbi:hypothetical protein [Eubacterium ramulus]